MSLLNIMPNVVRDKAHQMEVLRQADMETLKKIRILILGLEEHWKGEAQEAFVNKYLSQQNSLNEFYNTLEEFIKLLESAANGADDMDNELLNMVNGI